METHLAKKTLTVSRGHRYTYYTCAPAAVRDPQSQRESKPTILLIHGWPDDASCWSSVLNGSIVPAGYGVIAADCLGSGGSSMPLQEREYDFRAMAADLMEILEAENVPEVLIWAHDWGVGLASRFYNYYPSRVLALTFTNTNYFPPSNAPFSLDAFIEMTQKAHGYGIAWYWHLFTSDEAPQLMSEHIDTLWTILHGSGETWMETFCKQDGFRDALLRDDKKAVRSYATPEMKRDWVEKVQAEDNLRLKASLMWYRALAGGFQDEANKEAMVNLVLNVPYLLVRAEDDVCCKGEDHEVMKKAGLLGTDAEIVVIAEAGHWVAMSHPKEYGEKILGWLKRKGF